MLRSAQVPFGDHAGAAEQHGARPQGLAEGLRQGSDIALVADGKLLNMVRHEMHGRTRPAAEVDIAVGHAEQRDDAGDRALLMRPVVKQT